MDGVATRAGREIVSARMAGGGIAVLRVLFGAVWLRNGLTKVFFNQDSTFDWGFVKFNLINQPAARAILDGASGGTFQPLRWIYHDFVLGNWVFFAWFLTVAEGVAGFSLLFGLAVRLGC